MDSDLTDVKALLRHMKYADKQIKLKRRFLLGLPISKYEEKNDSLFQNRCLPEVLLRGDDVFCETAKSFVEKTFGIHNPKSDYHAFQDIPCIRKKLGSYLHNISNTGLYLLAMHLTKGQIGQNKTRLKLKKAIRECLKKMQKCKGKFHSQECAQLSHVVSDPCFFRKSGNSFNSSDRSSVDKARWVLSNLKKFSTIVLLSIHRKLRGKSGKKIELMIKKRSGWTRERLIDLVKKICEKELGEENGDELTLPMAKAMAVTTLSMKLTPKIQNPNLEGFYQFSPDIVALQNNIAMVISLIKKKDVRVPKLGKLKMLLGFPEDLSNTAIKNLLTFYLFECDDMGVIPKSLLDALSLINRSSQLKKAVNEEVECILGLSAQLKGVILDSLPDHDYEQEFADAYMEDLQESESESDESDMDYALLFGSDTLSDNINWMNDSVEPVEGFGDSLFTEEDVSHVDPTIPDSNEDIVAELSEGTSRHLISNSEPTDTRFIDIGEELDPTEEGSSSNKYLCLQDACDETSLFAYKCIDSLLSELARLQDTTDITEDTTDITEKQATDDDLGRKLICIVDEQCPSISNSVKAKLEELFSLK